ncbi:MAG: SDR family oxidoreductase [Anaerolineales bacterium]
MDNELQNRSVLITGTSTGIGRYAALQLDKLGFHVFATIRKEEDANSITSEASHRLIPLILDVTDPSSIDKAHEILSREISEDGLWGLVNNAAVGFVSPMEFVPMDDLRWLYEVNVFGLLAVAQKFLPLIRRAKGRILNISSSATLVVAPFHGPYSSSKLALNGLTDAMRLELRPLGVHVSLIIYGSVKTPIWDTAGNKSTQVTQDFPPEALSLYGENFGRLRAYFNRIGKAGISTEQAFQPILHALTAEKPKTHYIVGPDAKQYNLVKKLFYGRIGDWITMRTIGLSDDSELQNQP